MKREIIAGIVVAVLAAGAIAEPTRYPGGITIGSQADESSRQLVTGAAGDLYVAGNIEATGGILNATEVFFDVAAASTFTYVAGTSALGIVSTTTLVAAGTSYTLAVGDYSNTADPRNVTVAIWLNAGASTTTIVGTLVIAGTDARGNAMTESLTISSQAAVTGNIAWSSITSLTLSITSISPTTNANAYINIGTGVKVGLANSLAASGDIRKVNEGGSATTGYTANTTYNTITFENTPDGTREYKVTYKARSR